MNLTVSEFIKKSETMQISDEWVLDNIDNLFELWNNYFTICNEPTKSDKEEFLNYVEIREMYNYPRLSLDDSIVTNFLATPFVNIKILSSNDTSYQHTILGGNEVYDLISLEEVVKKKLNITYDCNIIFIVMGNKVTNEHIQSITNTEKDLLKWPQLCCIHGIIKD